MIARLWPRCSRDLTMDSGWSLRNWQIAAAAASRQQEVSVHGDAVSRMGHSVVMNVILLVKTLYLLVAQCQTAFAQRSGWTCFITLTVNQTMFYGSRVIKNGLDILLLQKPDLTPTAAEVQWCGIVNELGLRWWGSYLNCLGTKK